MSNDDVVRRYFSAMRRGAVAESELLALFHEDATYAEPFTSNQPAIGIQQIRQRFVDGWKHPLPELELDVLGIDIDGSFATSRWECRSPALDRPMRGEDRYEIRDGRIARLEVRLLDDEGEDESTA